MDVENRIMQSLREQRYTHCITLVKTANDELASKRAEVFEALKPLKERMKVKLLFLRDTFDHELIKVVSAASFQPEKYESLLRAYHELDKAGVPVGSVLRMESGVAVSAAPQRPTDLGAALVMAAKEVESSRDREGNLPTIGSKVQAALIAAAKDKSKNVIMERVLKLEDEGVIEPLSISAAQVAARSWHNAARPRASTGTGASVIVALDADGVAAAGTGGGGGGGGGGSVPVDEANRSALFSRRSGDPAAGSLPVPELSDVLVDDGSALPGEEMTLLQRRVEHLKAQRYQDLCARVPETHMALAVSDVCASLTDVMLVHYLIMQVRFDHDAAALLPSARMCGCASSMHCRVFGTEECRLETV